MTARVLVEPKFRYVTGAVSGFAITAGAANSCRKEATIFYVYDSADQYRPMREFVGPKAQERAEDCCRWLNLEEEAVRHLRPYGLTRA